MSGRPLDGVRVLDFTWVGAGPLATRFLADFGADVIKIESVKRPDPLRSTPPFKDGEPGLERSGYFANRNANKRCLALNMAHPEARDIVLRLAAQSDICTESFRPGTMERWRVGPGDLAVVNPSLVYLAMPLLGGWGPHAHYSGFGASLVALSGLYALCGDPDRPPVGTGTNYPDHVANPMHAAVAMLAALREVRRGKSGQYIELSQFESTLNVIGPALLQEDGAHPTRMGNQVEYAAPHGVYPSADPDGWLAISVMTDRQWSRFAPLLELPPAIVGELAEVAGRIRHRTTIDAAVEAWTTTRSQDGAAKLLQGLGVPAGAVADVSGVLTDDQLTHREAVQVLEHEVMGPTRYSAPVPKLSRSPGRLDQPAPMLGQHTEEVAGELLGMTLEEIQKARERELFV